MKLLAPFVFLIMLCGSTFAQYEFTCGGLDRMGRGELGEAPNWAIPFCNAEAERVETQIAADIDNLIFMQSYEALLDRYGPNTIANDIQSRMSSAGYIQASSETNEDEVVTTIFVNTDKEAAYIVLMNRKDIDYYLLLIKTKFWL